MQNKALPEKKQLRRTFINIPQKPFHQESDEMTRCELIQA